MSDLPDIGTSAPVVPVPAETLTQIVIVTPDGTMMIYDEAGDLTDEVTNTAYNLWLSEYGALNKQFDYYSVTEALLLPVAIAAVVTLLGKIFRRRKL